MEDFKIDDVTRNFTAFKGAKGLAAVATKCSKCVLGAQEIKSALESSDSVAEDIYKSEYNGHRDSILDRETPIIFLRKT